MREDFRGPTLEVKGYYNNGLGEVALSDVQENQILRPESVKIQL
jgi:hypothetical protein